MSSARIPNINVFKYPAFVWLWTGRIMASLATVTQNVAIGWQVYSVARLTRGVEESALMVGLVGLAQFVPLFMLVLLAGETADRYDRRKILRACLFSQMLCSVALVIVSTDPAPSLLPIFMIAATFGAVRAFMSPAYVALAPMLVPREALPRVVSWNTLATQSGRVLGPLMGGVLCTISPLAAYAAASILFASSLISFFLIKADTRPSPTNGSRLTLIREGLAYVWTNKMVFGAISLDLFAVLLGGVTALLPVFARDILHIGADGFGILRSAESTGGVLTTLMLSFNPIRRHAGVWMLASVIVFGLAMILFALSTVLWLSVIVLVVGGAADSISVFIRQSLVQIVTPDHMRGRVSAVSMLCISASNELGEFESGVAARILGPVGAAIFGGAGSITITALWAKLFPALRKADRLVE